MDGVVVVRPALSRKGPLGGGQSREKEDKVLERIPSAGLAGHLGARKPSFSGNTRGI